MSDSVGEWISADERVPEFDKSVLVYCRIYGRYPAYYKQLPGTNDGVWCGWDGERGKLPPTHWMPLPPPPE